MKEKELMTRTEGSRYGKRKYYYVDIKKSVSFKAENFWPAKRLLDFQEVVFSMELLILLQSQGFF